MKSTLVSSELWETIDEKMLEKRDVPKGTAEKGGKGLRVLRKGERSVFYLDNFDQVFEVEPIVIEGLNHAVNFGMSCKINPIPVNE